MCRAVLIGEEVLSSLETRRVNGSTREFAGFCPTHGSFRWRKFPLGRHTSVQETWLKKLFPKAHRKRLKVMLSSEDRKHFDRAIEGQALATEDEVARWQALLT
jgi:hypothetical protein